jgi:hypothetical protein
VDFMGLKYHPDCHACTECGQAIKARRAACARRLAHAVRRSQGSSVLAFGKAYHPACFSCTTCRTPFLGAGYFGFEAGLGATAAGALTRARTPRTGRTARSTFTR